MGIANSFITIKNMENNRMNHTYDEIRAAAIDILLKREHVTYSPDQYEHLKSGIAEIFQKRLGKNNENSFFYGHNETLSSEDKDIFSEVFWDLFREGIITLGLNDSNKNFPFFRLSSYGKKILESKATYFFHDVSTYTQNIQKEIPEINNTTMLYLQEAMKAFQFGCILSSSVMLGVAAEHIFLQLIEIIDENESFSTTYVSVANQKTIPQKIVEFKNVFEKNLDSFPPKIKDDIDTTFSGIISIISTYKNQSGYPTGKMIDKEQAFILLQLFIPYCKKIYQLINFFKQQNEIVS